MGRFDSSAGQGVDEAASAFARFVDWCYAAHGPFPRLMRRLPVYFVGKCAEAETPDKGVMRAGGHYYPPIWVWVTQQLKLEMARVAKASGAHMAYIDAIHTRGLLDDPDNSRKIRCLGGSKARVATCTSGDESRGRIAEFRHVHQVLESHQFIQQTISPTSYGAQIGQWKIQHEGPAVYWGLNHYAVDCQVHGRICYKHQGIEQ